MSNEPAVTARSMKEIRRRAERKRRESFIFGQREYEYSRDIVENNQVLCRKKKWVAIYIYIGNKGLNINS